MTTLSYIWDNDIWLLHVQATNKTENGKELVLVRLLERGKGAPEDRLSIAPGESYRFIISRDSMQESGIDIRFEKGLCVKIFRLLDRAYLPGDSDIVFTNEAGQ